MSPTKAEVENILRRLEQAWQELMEALETCQPQQFTSENAAGESLKRVLERTADDVSFYYGRLVAHALSLPPPPCLQRAEFASLREAIVSLQVAQRRFSNLLHDLAPADLERRAVDAEHGDYTLQQALEMAAAHYKMRAQQVRHLAAEVAGESR